MAITNGYTTLTAMKNFLSITDSSDDTLLEGFIESASRSIDRIANRRFYADAAASARKYRAYNEPALPNGVLTASTTTTLVFDVAFLLICKSLTISIRYRARLLASNQNG